MHGQVHLTRGTDSHYDLRCFDIEVSLPDCPATAVSLGWILARRGPGRRTVLLRDHKQRDHRVWSIFVTANLCSVSVFGPSFAGRMLRRM